MEDYDLKCLPTDFVGTSRPSKVISAFYRRKEKAEREMINEMNIRNKEICRKYENLIEEQSEKIKTDLNEVRAFIKYELHHSKVQANDDNAKFMEALQFQQMYERIQEYTKKQHVLVENFYVNLVKMETDKAKEFTEVLKQTYECIKRNSFKLPNEYDEVIELETKKINQTILCNNRNYVALKTQLQAEIQNHTKKAIQDLQTVKERWITIIKKETEMALEKLKSQTRSELNTVLKELNSSLDFSDTKNAQAWLNNIRRTLACLDQRAQKAIMAYKQAAVIVFKRYFEEFKFMEASLGDVIKPEDIGQAQAEMYTPTLEEIKEKYDVDTGTIQEAWNDLVGQLTTTVDNAYRFLLAAATLYQRHFKRATVLEKLMTKDLEVTIQLNNSLASSYEMKLNVLTDILRQESTKEKLKKGLDDIQKLVFAIEALYKSQHQSEVAVMKKYKSIQELRIEILLAEMNRFLKVYPPDMEIDPKIQRRRASQTDGILENPTEHLIPNQIIFCKYQIGAISNWQFGVWESIGNYSAIAKAEILIEIDKWVQKSMVYLEHRLEARYSINELRMEKIRAYIYEERLEELCLHQSRYNEHMNAVEMQLDLVKDEYQKYQGTYETILEDYKSDVGKIEKSCLDFENSYIAMSHKPVLNAKLEECTEKISKLAQEYLEKYEKFVQSVKASNVIWVKNIKLFSEGGNYSIQEAKDLLKDMEKLEWMVETTMKSIRQEVETDKGKIIETIQSRNVEVCVILHSVIEEHRFNETLDNKMKSLKRNLITVGCELQCKFKTINEEIEKYTVQTLAKCGTYNCFKDFLDGVTNIIQKLKDMAAYLNETEPVRFYSHKRSLEKGTSQHNIQVMTQRLFNFEILENRHTFFMDLNEILEKYWNDIIPYSKAFYETRHKSFIFGEDKIPHSLDHLMCDMYQEFCNIQNQCETRTMQDTKEYLNIAYNYLKALEEYIKTYVEDYVRNSVHNFDLFFDTQIRQPLNKSKEDFINQYAELQKKLMTLSGHPKNRKLLEKLQIEAEIINSVAKDMVVDIKSPHFANLKEEFDKITRDFYVVTDLINEILKAILSLKITVDNLAEKLKQKVNILRKKTKPNKSVSKVILSNCMSFLLLYDSKTVLESDSNMHDPSQSLTENTDSYVTQSLGSATITPITSLYQAQMSTTPSSKGSVIFPTEFKESYDKYYEEVESENFEDILESLKKEWDYAVLSVLNLYTVKYNHQRG